MAKFELNTYGKNDEILVTFETDRVRWGVFAQALKLADDLEKMSAEQQFAAIGEFVKKIFTSLTSGATGDVALLSKYTISFIGEILYHNYL